MRACIRLGERSDARISNQPFRTMRSKYELTRRPPKVLSSHQLCDIVAVRVAIVIAVCNELLACRRATRTKPHLPLHVPSHTPAYTSLDYARVEQAELPIHHVPHVRAHLEQIGR